MDFLLNPLAKFIASEYCFYVYQIFVITF